MSDDESKLDDSGGGEEPVIKSSTGRTRFCKQCKFSCTDSKAFLQHRLVVHSESEDAKISKRNDSKVTLLKSAIAKSQINMADLLLPEEKKKVENNTDMENCDDDDDDNRLIIAENEMPTQPTRSGNIQNRNYSCKMCDFTTNSGKTYLNHEKDHHKIDITIYACDLCDYATKYKQKLPRHRKLHFSGVDTELNPSASDNNDTAEETMIMESVPEFMEPEEEEEMYDDKEDEPSIVTDTPVLPSMEVTPKQPRKKRQEVDPAKYVKVVDDTGIKFACSMCGNIYKWRKSLNKHWNEKHFGEEPDRTKPPPALATITLPLASDLPGFSAKVKSHKFNSKYDSVTSNVSSPSSSYYLESRSQTATPNMAKETSGSPVDASRAIVMPKIIGPFITDSYVPMYPTTSTPSRIHGNTSEVLDLSHKGEDVSTKDESANEEEDDDGKTDARSQDQPLDFSVKKEPPETYGNSSLVLPADYTAATELLALQASFANIDKGSKQVLQCDKCGFVAKTLVDYSSHMTLHLNKRAFKCAECQAHFSGVEDLNEHFVKLHSNKLHEHKEAIQKIPHGLQQTYHLLKMPLDAITNISSQELHATTNKQLKCNMCEFVAKWPAELQKHAVSHSEERPFVCMVCGSTYKWKWDLVKHFEKSHHTMPNPYKRRDHGQLKSFSPPPKSNITALIDAAKAVQDIHPNNNNDEQPSKKRRLSETDIQLTIENNLNNFDNLETCSTHSDSSVSMSAEGIKMDEDSASKLMISNIHTLSPNSIDFAKQEYEDQNAADKHQAIMSHVRQRLVMGPPKLVKANQVQLKQISSSDVLLPYKCSLCEYRARWPSEITQHMKNHSDEKPYHCPRCTYKSKWKWDVVKHLKRCGGGTVKDVIDTTKQKKFPVGPPNALVLPQGNLRETTPQVSSSKGVMLVTTNGDMAYQNSLQATNVNLVQSLNAPSLDNHKLLNDIMKYEGSSDFYENGITKQSPPNQLKHTTFKSLVNQGLYHCLECPFIGHSPAELRRHSLLHSEDKPFVCDVCGYCTRWKCDLKKHIRTYNHFSSTQPQSDSESTQSSTIPPSNQESNMIPSSPNQNPVYVYKCPKCAYVTSKRHMYEIHMKIHGQQLPPSTSSHVVNNTETSGKFKCNKCSFTANDLSAFLQHKLTHSTQQNSSNNTNHVSDPLTNEISMRTFYMKHRRKPVQQFKCSKCPYVCFKKSGLELHSAMHEPRGEDALQCYYCDYNVFSKNLLIQHMRLHPEYNPNDCVEMFNEEDIKANYKKTLEAENLAKIQSENKILEKLKQMESLRPQNNKMKYNCEWCDAVLPNVAYLYRHSKMAHIGELKNQEMEMAVQVDENGNHAPQILSPESFNKSLSEAMDLSRTTESLFDQMDQSLSSPNNTDDRSSTPTKSRKSANPHKRLRSFQCTKCPFTAPNAVTYLRHMERHGSNCKNTCQLCDYSIDRLNLLYQHMKQVHGISSGKLADGDELTNEVECMKSTETNDATKTNEPDINDDKMAYSEDDMDTDMSDKPVIEIEGETWWRGVCILACTVNGRKNYKCPKCTFISSDAKITANHSEQHIHDGEDVEGNSEDVNQEIEKMTNTSSEPTEIPSPKQHIPTYGHICPKCPFRGKSKELLQRHLEMHEYNGKYHCKSCDYSVDRMNLLHQHNRVHEVDKNRPMSQSPFTKSPEANFFEEKATEETKSQGLESDSNEDIDEDGGDDFEMEYMDEIQTGEIPTENNRANGQVKYKCVHCPFNTLSKSEIFKHKKKHNIKSTFSCPHCNYSANREHLLQQHIRFHMNIQNSDQENLDSSIVADDIPGSKLFKSEMKNGDAFIETDKYGDSHLIKCGKCPYKTKTASDYNKHIRLHGASFQYKCDYCSYSHAHSNMVLKHRMVHKNEEGFDVTPSPEKLINFHINSGKQTNSGLSQLEGIIDEIGQSAKFECSQCPYKCNSSKVYTIHKQMHGVNKKYICDYCDWSSERINLIFQHRKVHCKEGDFIANAENLTFLNRQHALNSSIENGLMNDEVNLCNGTAESSGSPDKKKLYMCKLCPFSCNNKNNFAYHKTLHKVSSKYTCNMCSYSVDRFNLLSQHLRLHQSQLSETNGDGSNMKKSNCPSSPHSNTSSEELLDSSKRLHIADKQFSCSFCDFSTDRQHILQMHLRVHEDTSPFEELDVKSYTNSSPETDPPKLYFTSPCSPEKPANEIEPEYKCERCPYSASSPDKLKEHELQHNIQKTFVCPYCDYSCAEEYQMRDHVKVHFPGTDDASLSDIINKQNINEIKSSDRVDVMPSVAEADSDKETNENSDLVKLPGKDIPLENNDTEGENKNKSQGTKVYVCQYCEREFESKSQMLLHEKQHLIGNTSK